MRGRRRKRDGISKRDQTFKMLEASGCTELEKSMILAGIKYDKSNPAKLYTDMEDSLKIADENIELFANTGDEKQGKQRRRSHSESEVLDKNPICDGQRLKCYFCNSEYHMKSKCEEYRWKEKAEKRKKAKGHDKASKDGKEGEERVPLNV